jgi:hypothetical protein
MVTKVRHAQDIEAEVSEGDWDWATATIRVRYVRDLDDTTRVQVRVLDDATSGATDVCIDLAPQAE